MAERGKVLTELGVYADPKLMKARYGIAITAEQVRLAEQALAYYRTVDNKTLARMPDAEALRWPYPLSDAQRLDALMQPELPSFTIPQTIVWRTLRPKLERTAGQYPDVNAVAKAVRDIEGFMQLNAYLGDFKENRALLADEENKLMALFAMSYKNHQSQGGRNS